MPKLFCVHRYQSAQRTVEAGETIEVSAAEAIYLRADAPDCWADDARTAKALDHPLADKAIKRAPVKK